MTDSLLQRIEQLESALATTRAELQKALAIANAANQAHGRIDQLSQRVDQERVLNREVFIQSGCGGYLSDRNDAGGQARFQGSTNTWETMTLRPK